MNDKAIGFAVVGGFLGADRTTLLAAAAPRLGERGLRFRFAEEECFKPSPPRPAHRVTAPPARHKPLAR